MGIEIGFDHIHIILQLKFWSEFLESKIVSRLYRKIVNIEKRSNLFEFNRKEIKNDEIYCLFQLNLTFPIKFDFLDLLIDI